MGRPDLMEEAARAHGEFADASVKDNLGVIILRALERVDAAAEQRGREEERERWKPAATYFGRYCQDEAEDVEHCVCGEQQHEDAKAFAAAIRRGEP